jgi:hypothetical protein
MTKENCDRCGKKIDLPFHYIPRNGKYYYCSDECLLNHYLGKTKMIEDNNTEGRELLGVDEVEKLYNEALEHSHTGGDPFADLDENEQAFIKKLLCISIKYDWERAEKEPTLYGSPVHREVYRLAAEIRATMTKGKQQ